MKTEKNNKKEYEQIINYIKYGIYELQRDALLEEKISINIPNEQAIIEQILIKYKRICKHYMELHLINQMDTFEKSACLFMAIEETKIIKDDNKMNFDLSLDISLNMCTKPTKRNKNEMIELEEVDYKNTLSQSTTFDLYKINKELLMYEVMEQKHKLTIKDLSTTFEALYKTTKNIKVKSKVKNI